MTAESAIDKFEAACRKGFDLRALFVTELIYRVPDELVGKVVEGVWARRHN